MPGGPAYVVAGGGAEYCWAPGYPNPPGGTGNGFTDTAGGPKSLRLGPP